MGKKKGFYLDFSPPPFPDAKMAEENLATTEEIEQIKTQYKPVDPKTGLTYAQVVSKNIPQVIEEKEEITAEQLEQFRKNNPWVFVHGGVIQEINPLDTEEITDLPPPESLFNIK